jgi:hypothetical protein
LCETFIQLNPPDQRVSVEGTKYCVIGSEGFKQYKDRSAEVQAVTRGWKGKVVAAPKRLERKKTAWTAPGNFVGGRSAYTGARRRQGLLEQFAVARVGVRVVLFRYFPNSANRFGFKNFQCCLTG